MKKLFVLLSLVSASASFATADIACELVTPENCVEYIRCGTPKDVVRARVVEMLNNEEISKEVADKCLEAIENCSAE